jgi:hypothetical protein
MPGGGLQANEFLKKSWNEIPLASKCVFSFPAPVHAIRSPLNIGPLGRGGTASPKGLSGFPGKKQ